MSTTLETGLKIVTGELPAPPSLQLVGIVPKALEPGRAVFELAADARHHNPMGTVHGSIFCDLAAAAIAMTLGATLGEGESTTTVEFKIPRSSASLGGCGPRGLEIPADFAERSSCFVGLANSKNLDVFNRFTPTESPRTARIRAFPTCLSLERGRHAAVSLSP